jgi:uncharacterized protein YaaQ
MAKKMLLAILDDVDSSSAMRALQDEGYVFTLIDSTGSLLRKGNSTFIAAVDEKDINTVIDIFNQMCSPQSNPFKSRGSLMVFEVDHFEQIQ